MKQRNNLKLLVKLSTLKCVECVILFFFIFSNIVKSCFFFTFMQGCDLMQTIEFTRVFELQNFVQTYVDSLKNLNLSMSQVRIINLIRKWFYLKTVFVLFIVKTGAQRIKRDRNQTRRWHNKRSNVKYSNDNNRNIALRYICSFLNYTWLFNFKT